MVVDKTKPKKVVIEGHESHRISSWTAFCKNFPEKFMYSIHYCHDCGIPVGTSYEIFKDYDKKLERAKEWRSR